MKSQRARSNDPFSRLYRNVDSKVSAAIGRGTRNVLQGLRNIGGNISGKTPAVPKRRRAK